MRPFLSVSGRGWSVTVRGALCLPACTRTSS
jgi:hypothetical protein